MKTTKKSWIIPAEDDPQGQLMVYTPRTEEDRKAMSDRALKLKQVKAVKSATNINHSL